jgi:hypothetical protein
MPIRDVRPLLAHESTDAALIMPGGGSHAIGRDGGPGVQPEPAEQPMKLHGASDATARAASRKS